MKRIIIGWVGVIISGFFLVTRLLLLEPGLGDTAAVEVEGKMIPIHYSDSYSDVLFVVGILIASITMIYYGWKARKIKDIANVPIVKRRIAEVGTRGWSPDDDLCRLCQCNGSCSYGVRTKAIGCDKYIPLTKTLSSGREYSSHLFRVSEKSSINPDWNRLRCPECNSDKVSGLGYGGSPRYGCKSCGKVFT